MGWYWTAFLVAWGAAALFIVWQLRRHGLGLRVGLDVVLVSIPLIPFFTHLFSLWDGLGEIEDQATFWLTLEGWRSGHTSFGAVAGGLLALYLAARLHRRSFLLLADLAAPALFVATPFMRVGCFRTGCCFGAPTDLPWGVRFSLDHPFTPFTPPSHPVQIYELLLSLVVLACLPALFRRTGAAAGSGQRVLLSLLLYCGLRFSLEWVRIGGTSYVAALGMSPAQLQTLGAGLVCAGLLVHLRRRDAGILPSR